MEYYIQQKWPTTNLQTKEMTEFAEIHTSKLQNTGKKTTTIPHFMLESVDVTGNCMICDADYTPSGIPEIIINQEAALLVETIQQPTQVNTHSSLW